MHILRIIGLILLVGGIGFGAMRYMEYDEFDPSESAVYEGGNGTFTSIEKLGGLSVYIKTGSMSCSQSDVEIYRPSTNDDSFWAGTSYFNDDCDDSWDVTGWTYIGLLANTFAFEEGEQIPKLTGGVELTVETNVDVLVADHTKEDEAFNSMFGAIPMVVFGLILFYVGGADAEGAEDEGGSFGEYSVEISSFDQSNQESEEEYDPYKQSADDYNPFK